MFYFFEILNGELEKTFDEETYLYNVYVGEDTNFLQLNFKMHEGCTINVVGNKDFMDKENYVFVEITKNEKVTTYTFIVHKESAETVFEYDEAIPLEITNKNNAFNYTFYIIVICIILIVVLFKIIFRHKKTT